MNISQIRVGFSTALLLCVLGAACNDTVTCEPLAEREVAIELAEILAIGRTQDGTIVVVDQPDDPRLFLSEGSSLVSYRVAGGGSSNAGGAESWLLSVTETDPPTRVLVQRKDDVLRMKLYQGDDALDTKSLDFEAAQGDELELLDESAIAALTVRELPGKIIIEYFARVGDDRLVVTRPDKDRLVYEDMRLFFGAPDKMIEREISGIERARDGGSTQIDFDLDGSDASVFFPSQVRPNGAATTTPARFMADDKARAITRVLPPEDPELDDLSFQCLED